LRVEEIGEAPPGGWIVEDKYDGIRAQIHKEGGEVRIFSRGQGEVQGRFPDVVETLVRLQGAFLLDGEIVAGDGERILPFRMLQRRLGRRHLSPSLLAEYPCRYVAFDLLFQEGTSLFDTPLIERRRRLEALAVEVSQPEP